MHGSRTVPRTGVARRAVLAAPIAAASLLAVTTPPSPIPPCPRSPPTAPWSARCGRLSAGRRQLRRPDHALRGLRRDPRRGPESRRGARRDAERRVVGQPARRRPPPLVRAPHQRARRGRQHPRRPARHGAGGHPPAARALSSRGPWARSSGSAPRAPGQGRLGVPERQAVRAAGRYGPHPRRLLRLAGVADAAAATGAARDQRLLRGGEAMTARRSAPARRPGWCVSSSSRSQRSSRTS